MFPLALTSLSFSLRLFQKAFSERLKQTLGLTPEHVSVLKVDPCSPTLLLDKDSNMSESIVVTPKSAPDDSDDIRLPIGLSSEDADEEAGAEDNDEGLPAVYLTGKELEDEDEDEAGSCGGSSAGYEKRMNAAVQLAEDEMLEGYRCRRSGENEWLSGRLTSGQDEVFVCEALKQLLSNSFDTKRQQIFAASFCCCFFSLRRRVVFGFSTMFNAKSEQSQDSQSPYVLFTHLAFCLKMFVPMY